MLRMSNRSIGRVFLQCICCSVFFLLGSKLNPSTSPVNCIHKLDPNHLQHPELLEGFHGLKQKNTFVVFAIISFPRNYEQRKAIRQTWLNVPDRKVKAEFLHFFVIGSQDLSEDDEAQLRDENAAHKDLLLLPLLDSYPTLTTKVLKMFVVLNRNVQFKYLVKLDDDTYVRIPELVDDLHHSNYDKALYWGFFDGRAPVQKRGKWAEPSYVLCDRYLPYALGGGYVLSHDLVEFIADNADRLQSYKSEDVSVGTWLAPLKVNRIHDTRFDTEFKSRGCSNKYLVTHKQTVQDMRSKHYSITSSGLLCEKEEQLRTSYKYDWSALPSQCCVRDDSTLP